MSIFQKTSAYCLTALLAGAGIAGCGSTGPSNDQGTSYLALGYFTVVDEERVPIGSIDATLNSENPVLSATGQLVDGRRDRILIGTENRLSAQYIRQTRIDCSFEVPGSNLSIPGTSTVSGRILSPAVFDDGDNVPTIPQPNPDATVEEGGRAQFWFATVNLIPTDIYAFLNNNSNSLPQLPFLMNVDCVAVGVTQAGDILETNAVSIPVTFFDESDVVSSEPSSSAASDGEASIIETESETEANSGSSSQVDGSETVDTDEFIF